MKNVKVGDRAGVTDGKPMPMGGCYAVWFTGSDKPEFIHHSKIEYLPMNNKSCYEMWREGLN